MSGSLNKVSLIGRVGIDPEIRTTQDGRELAKISLATSDSWKDKATGERKEKTEWHKVIVFSSGLVEVIKNYVRKGSKIYIEGSLQTRKWTDEQGKDQYITEVILQNFNSSLVMLDNKKDGDSAALISSGVESGANSSDKNTSTLATELDDEIPF